MTSPEWWKRPRKVSVIVDNESWILPYAQKLVEYCAEEGDEARLCRSHDEVWEGGIAFFLGCTKIASPNLLQRNRRNLVVHASDLPKGRGMSPWTWQVIEGRKTLPVCLLEADVDVDSGDIIYKEWMALEGGELVSELRQLIGQKTLELCKKYLVQKGPSQGQEQVGEPTFYRRRTPEDSRIDPHKTIESQFNLLRVVDNEKYPAFFDYRGKRYFLKIEKKESDE